MGTLFAFELAAPFESRRSCFGQLDWLSQYEAITPSATREGSAAGKMCNKLSEGFD
jgi:hypothetical protein